MSSRAVSASLLLLLLPLTACGQTAGPPPAEPSPLSAACTALYGSYVIWARGCTGAEPGRAQIEDLAAGCAVRAALPGIEMPATRILSCGDKVAASSCAALPLECLTPGQGYEQQRGRLTDVVSFAEGGGFFELFPRAKGTLASGLACDLDAQCRSGACSSAATCGVCVDVRGPGEACGATTTCGVGSDCKNGICVDTRSPLGAACSAPKGESVCQAGLYCTGHFCATHLAVGAACTGNPADECSPGATCDASTCRSITEGHPGDACDGIAARCVEGTFCQYGSCHVPVASVPLGGACDNDVCALGLSCSYGQCWPTVKGGDHCLIDGQCGAGFYCGTDMVCAAPSHEGEACSVQHGCEVGLFCDGPTARCRREAGAGAACDAAVPCHLPFACRDGICGNRYRCSAR